MIEVDVKPLREAMKAMVAVVESRSTVPILSDVLIRSAPGAMTMITTDLDIIVELHVDLADPGQNKAMEFCVSAATLQRIAAKLPAEGRATIASDGNTGITVACGRSKFKLPTLAAEEFPLIAAGDWDSQFEISGPELVQMIDSVDFAISTDETRYYLNGIYIHPDHEQLIAAATDGHRLAKFVREMPEGAETMPGVIVSRKTVKLLDMLLSDYPGKVDVAVSRTKIQFDIGALTMTAKLIDGQFPDYNRVIPVSNNKALWFNPDGLSEAVDRCAVVSSEKTRIIKLDVASDKVVLTVTSPENGIATEELEVEYDAEPVTIGFNSGFLLDVLKRMNSDTAQVMLADSTAPTLWRDSENAARTYVLMPMRV